MIPEEHKKEWDAWMTKGYDARYDKYVRPFDVVTFRKFYGHFRPDNLPHRGDWAFISPVLIPALRERSVLPEWFWDGDAPDEDTPVVRIFCSTDEIDTDLVGFGSIKSGDAGLAFIPLAPRNGPQEW
jgi:hypothetical protein